MSTGTELVLTEAKKLKNVKDRCFLLYVTTDKSLKEVSEDMNISLSTIKNWSAKYKWKLFRSKISDKFEGLMELTQERLQFFESLVFEFRDLFDEVETVKDKVMIADVIMRLDRRISEWLLLGELSE